MDYAKDGSQGSYHTAKLEENIVLVPVMEPTLPPANQSLLLSDQENIPPRMVTPPLLNVLVEILEEEKPWSRSAAEQPWWYVTSMQCGVGEESQSPINIQPKCTSPATARLSNTSRSPSNEGDESDDSSEALEVMSPQVSQERMGSLRVMDLPRYHSLVEDFG